MPAIFLASSLGRKTARAHILKNTHTHTRRGMRDKVHVLSACLRVYFPSSSFWLVSGAIHLPSFESRTSLVAVLVVAVVLFLTNNTVTVSQVTPCHRKRNRSAGSTPTGNTAPPLGVIAVARDDQETIVIAADAFVMMMRKSFLTRWILQDEGTVVDLPHPA